MRGPGHHDAQVDDLVVVAAEHDAHDVLADVVDIALDRGHDDAAGGLPRGLRVGAAVGGHARRALRLDVRDEVGHGLLHDPGALDHLGQEHPARAEQVADHVHARHQRSLDDLDGTAGGQARLLRVRDDEVADALHQRMAQALLDGPLAPGQVASGATGDLLADGVGHLQHPLRGVRPAVQHQVLDALAQVRVQVVHDRQRPGVDDAHVHARRDGVDQEHGVDGLPDRVVAPERERDVGHAAADEHARQLRLDAPGRLDVRDGVAVVLLDAGADGEDVGVEDDVLGVEARLLREQPMDPVGDGHPLLDRLGLALLVEGHDHDRGAVPAREAGLAQELRLALLERQGVDDRAGPGRT